MSRKTRKARQREEKQRLRAEQEANEPPKPLSKKQRRALYRRLITCLFIAYFLHKLVHGCGLLIDNYVRITPRYIIWRLLEEHAQTTKTNILIAA